MNRRLLVCELLVLPLQLAAAAWFHSGWWLLGLLPWAGLLAWSLLHPKCAWWGEAMHRFPTRGREVLIVIDHAPQALELQATLDLLARYQARALFMVSGARAKKHPELVQRIAACGHAVGCTAMNAEEPDFWRMGPQALRSQLRASVQAVRGAMPAGAELRWFRSPGDQHNAFLDEVLVELQLERVGWTARDDGARLKDREAMLVHFRQHTQPGAILLLRQGQTDANGQGSFLWLLEELLLWLRGQGYSLG
jgi:peptidoglycan-N-acetylglucosamine deacetylase